jgi:hypothetical protein
MKLLLNIILLLASIGIIVAVRNIYVSIVCAIVFLGIIIVFNKETLLRSIYEDAYDEMPYVEKAPDFVPLPIEEPSMACSRTGTCPMVNPGCSDIDFTDTNLFLIYTKTDLEGARDRALTNKHGVECNPNNDKHTILLMNDIDMGDDNGNAGVIDTYYFPKLSGTFDGNCFAIKNFIIQHNSSSRSGNFGFFSGIKAVAIPVEDTGIHGHGYAHTLDGEVISERDNHTAEGIGPHAHDSNIIIYKPAVLRNITFRDFSFDVSSFDKKWGSGGIIGAADTPQRPEPNYNKLNVLIENVTVIANKDSSISSITSITSTKVGILCGSSRGCIFRNCDIIVSGMFAVNAKNDVAFGGISGQIKYSVIERCSVNLIGCHVDVHTTATARVGLLTGEYTKWPGKWKNDCEILNNIVLLKDAVYNVNSGVKTEFNAFIYVNPDHITCEHNTLLNFDSSIPDDANASRENNTNKRLTSGTDEITLNDQIYGMRKGDGSESDSGGTELWKTTYYVYTEEDVNNYSCEKYKIVNFWKNADDFYCDKRKACNKNGYGICFNMSISGGMGQFGSSVIVGAGGCPSRDQLFFNSYSKHYTLVRDVTIDSTWTPVDVDDDFIFDGAGYTITYNGTDKFQGLFKCVNNRTATIKNINFVLNTDLNDKAGCIIASCQIIKGYNLTVLNCHTSGTGIIGTSGGGVVGYEGGYNAHVTVRNCSNGLIIGRMAGGIVGRYFGRCASGQKCIIEYCFNTGEIKGNDSGGITGLGCGRYINATNLGFVHIRYCYSKCTMTGKQTGGICGRECGFGGGRRYNREKGESYNGSLQHKSLSGYVLIEQCYANLRSNNEYDIPKNSGGIVGHASAKSHGNVHLYHCYVIGDCYPGRKTNEAQNKNDNDGGAFLGDGTRGGNYLVNCYYVGVPNGREHWWKGGDKDKAEFTENVVMSESGKWHQPEALNTIGAVVTKGEIIITPMWADRMAECPWWLREYDEGSVANGEKNNGEENNGEENNEEENNGIDNFYGGKFGTEFFTGGEFETEPEGGWNNVYDNNVAITYPVNENENENAEKTIIGILSKDSPWAGSDIDAKSVRYEENDSKGFGDVYIMYIYGGAYFKMALVDVFNDEIIQINNSDRYYKYKSYTGNYNDYEIKYYYNKARSTGGGKYLFKNLQFEEHI